MSADSFYADLASSYRRRARSYLAMRWQSVFMALLAPTVVWVSGEPLVGMDLRFFLVFETVACMMAVSWFRKCGEWSREQDATADKYTLRAQEGE